jgi:hypothetical protein
MITIPKTISTNKPAAILPLSTDVSSPARVIVTGGVGIPELPLQVLPTPLVPPLLGAETGVVA